MNKLMFGLAGTLFAASAATYLEKKHDLSTKILKKLGRVIICDEPHVEDSLNEDSDEAEDTNVIN